MDLAQEQETLRTALAEGLGGEIEELRRLSLFKRWLELALFALFVAAGMTLILRQLGEPPSPAGTVLRVAGTLIAALGLNAFVLLFHDGMHGTLFRSPGWNRSVSFVLAGCVLISFSAYRVLHERHHRFLGSSHDPDEYSNYTASSTRLWLLHYVRLTVGCVLYLVLIPILAWRRGTRTERRHIAQEAAVLVVVYPVLLAVLPGAALLHAWFYPLLIVAFLTQARGFTQHGLTEPSDPLLASRSIHPGPLVRFLVLNENYHLEHHLFPEVPSYNLRKLHLLLARRLPRMVTGTSYLGFLARFLRATWKRDESPIGVTAQPPL